MNSKGRSSGVEDVEHNQDSIFEPENAYVPGTDEEKKLVRKIDLFLLPTIWLMYLLSYMDRTNIGNAKVAGMATDLDLDSGKYSITLVVFFIGYVLCEIPSNMVLARSRPSVFLPTIMFIWGCLTIGMAWVKNYQGLLAFRIVIGCMEAGNPRSSGYIFGSLAKISAPLFTSSVHLFSAVFYSYADFSGSKKAEQSKRFAVYISAAILSGAFGGLIAGAIEGGLDGKYGIAGWRWLFIVEGAMTAGWSIIASFILLDFPANSKRLTERERKLAIQRIQSEFSSVRTKDTPELGHLKALGQALRNWRVWVLTLGYMVIVGSSTLSYFYPTLVQGLGYSARDAQYMTVPIYGVSFVITAITGYFTDRVPQNRGAIISCWLSVSMTCAIIICATHDFKARYVLLCFTAAGLWATNAVALSYASSTFGSMPNEVRAISLAFVNAMSNLSQIYGAYLFPSTDAPQYLMGFGVISGMCALGVVTYAGLHIALRRWPLK